MKGREAVPDEAPAMGRGMGESWLRAHRGQVPDAAWQKRLKEWTPDVSAQGWTRTLAELANGHDRPGALLVGEADAGVPVALVLGTEAGDDASGSVAEIGALYVLPDRQGQGIGRLLMVEASRRLATLGFTTLHVGVLTANLPARAFYQALGGQEIGQRTFEEDAYLLPGTVYAWMDIAVLGTDFRERTS